MFSPARCPTRAVYAASLATLSYLPVGRGETKTQQTSWKAKSSSKTCPRKADEPASLARPSPCLKTLQTPSLLFSSTAREGTPLPAPQPTPDILRLPAARCNHALTQKTHRLLRRSTKRAWAQVLAEQEASSQGSERPPSLSVWSPVTSSPLAWHPLPFPPPPFPYFPTPLLCPVTHRCRIGLTRQGFVSWGRAGAAGAVL